MPTVNQTRLQQYLDAEARVLKGQSVQFGERRLQLADLAEIRAAIASLQAAVNRETRSGSSAFAQADFGGRT